MTIDVTEHAEDPNGYKPPQDDNSLRRNVTVSALINLFTFYSIQHFYFAG